MSYAIRRDMHIHVYVFNRDILYMYMYIQAALRDTTLERNIGIGATKSRDLMRWYRGADGSGTGLIGMRIVLGGYWEDVIFLGHQRKYIVA